MHYSYGLKQRDVDAICNEHQKYLSGMGGICANFSSYALTGLDLSGRNLTGASFVGSDLAYTDFTHSILKNCDFTSSNLILAKIDDSEKYRLGEILTEDLIGYKALREEKLCILRIPKGNKVFGINGIKFRTSSAIVEKIISLKDGTEHNWGKSFFIKSQNGHDYLTDYFVGRETIAVDFYSTSYNEECASGIHFYKDKSLAVKLAEKNGHYLIF